jgi:hypothetical protein
VPSWRGGSRLADHFSRGTRTRRLRVCGSAAAPSAGRASELIDQQCQARLLIVRAEPAGTGEGGDAVQSAPGNLGQGVRVRLAGQWCDSFCKLARVARNSRGASGQLKGSSVLRVNMAS